MTPSSRTGTDDFGAAALVLSSVGDPGHPARVLGNGASGVAMIVIAVVDVAFVYSVVRRRSGR